MKILVNGNVYEGDAKYAKNCLDLAKEKYCKENANAIYAVEKDDTVEMKKLVFQGRHNMRTQIAAFEKRGFKVHFTERRT